MQTTAIIKTLIRKDCLKRLIESVRKFYPDLPLLVADDSKDAKAEHGFGPNVTMFPLPYDIGLGYARNYLAERVTTPYLLYLDDDFIFTEKTDVNLFERILDGTDFDIIGGTMQDKRNGKWTRRNYHGTLMQRGRIMFYCTKCRSTVPFENTKVQHVDMILNFWLGKTERVRSVGWDSRLKINTHSEFFISAKKAGLKVGYTDAAEIFHISDQTPEYKKLRERQYYKLALEKHGLDRYVYEPGFRPR